VSRPLWGVGVQTSSGLILRLALYMAPILIAALIAIFYFGSGPAGSTSHSGSVQVSGSETMRPAVTACAEDFMMRYPQADVIVRGGGSGDGVAALLHGLVDIAMASRELSKRERDYANARGIELTAVPLALDGVTIIAHRNGAVGALNLSQVQAIFAGRISNWRELEGPDTVIHAFARAEGSGTASLFGERVMSEARYAASVQRLPTNEAIVAEVAKRPGAIGYTGLGALRGSNLVQAVALRRDLLSAPVAVDAETVRSRQYPLVRALSFVSAGHLSGTAKAFLDACLSPRGQALFQRAGYVGMTSGS
jgi:phosphate transport system substrate-binding protein